MKPHRHFGPFGLFLVFKKDESPLPFLRNDSFHPLRKIGIRVIGTAQAQVPQCRRTDDFTYLIIINISDAQAASIFTKDVQNFNIEPGRAAELECAGYIAGNQREKILQRGAVCTKTLGKLKKDRNQFTVQN